MKTHGDAVAAVRRKIIDWAKSQTEHDFHGKSLLYLALQFMRSFRRDAPTTFIIGEMSGSEIDGMFGEAWDALKKEGIV